MACQTIQGVSIPNLKFLDQSKQSYGPKKLEHFLLCNIEKWIGGHSFAHWPQYKCVEIFLTLNSCNSCIYTCINMKLAENFQNGVISIV